CSTSSSASGCSLTMSRSSVMSSALGRSMSSQKKTPSRRRAATPSGATSGSVVPVLSIRCRTAPSQFAAATAAPASPAAERAISIARMNPTFMLGGELEVRRLGFGAMRIVSDPDEGVRVLRRAVELGVTLIDTADIYGAGRSEEIIAEALHPYPEGLVIATKGGLGYGLQERIRDARPERLRRACDESLRRLKLERIDLYQLHRHDPEVPLEDSVGALEELRQEGKIRLIGLSNVSV